MTLLARQTFPDIDLVCIDGMYVVLSPKFDH